MENESMETRKPRIAKKYRLPIVAILMISAIVIGAIAAVLFTQNYTYTVTPPGPASVGGTPTLDFGALTGATSGSKAFTAALVVGAGTTSSITFAFVNPTTTWDTVFSGINIQVQTQAAAPVGKACISSGTGTCPTGLTASFTPTASTNYDYVAFFTPVSTVPTGVSLQTTWSPTPTSSCNLTPVSLGSAGSFGVLASSTITNTGATVITGDLGLSPGTSVTGFPPGTVSGVQHVNDATATTAVADLATALSNANALTGATIVSGDLGGMTLTCGVYKSTSSLGITGTLTLDAQGNANAVFVIQMGSTLTTAAGATIILANGAQAKNVFWAVGSSATLGATNLFKGTIMALASITIGAGATIDGRAQAQTAAVTLDSDTITVPA